MAAAVAETVMKIVGTTCIITMAAVAAGMAVVAAELIKIAAPETGVPPVIVGTHHHPDPNMVSQDMETIMKLVLAVGPDVEVTAVQAVLFQLILTPASGIHAVAMVAVQEAQGGMEEQVTVRMTLTIKVPGVQAAPMVV